MNIAPLVKHFPLNDLGRDFIIGDLHGHWSVLERLLEEVSFDKAKDRLFSVGDLVDRGPESHRFEEFIFCGWFHAVRGNHDQFVISLYTDSDHHIQNGGSWFVYQDTPTKQEQRASMGTLPLAIDVQTKHGLVGIVHADVPFENWDCFVNACTQWDKSLVDRATWTRDRWRHPAWPALNVQMVDYVFVGHSAHDEVTIAGNVIDLDTGCGYKGGKLTLWSIDEMKVAAEGRY